MRKTLVLGLVVVSGMGGLAYAQTVLAGPAVPPPSDTIIAARQAGYDLQAGVSAGMRTMIDAGGDVRGLVDGVMGLSSWAM